MTNRSSDLLAVIWFVVAAHGESSDVGSYRVLTISAIFMSP